MVKVIAAYPFNVNLDSNVACHERHGRFQRDP